jgi:hypothetical protein
MKITLNELRNIVRNILKENINYPEVDLSSNKKIAEAWVDTYSKIKEYLQENLKIYNYKTESYDSPFEISYLSLGNPIPNFGSERFSIQLKPFLFGFLSIDIETEKGKLRLFKFNLDIDYDRLKSNGYEAQPFFESQKDVDLILQVCIDVAKKFMSTDLDINDLKNKISFNTPDKILFKNSGNSGSQEKAEIGSSDFRRGGEMSVGKSGDFKGKFPQKGFDNYDEWIGDVESSKKFAIETLYDLVKDGDMSPNRFSDKVKSILNSPSNKQSKFSSSEFRRGGEMSFGKSGDYKGKFPQKGFDNYDEWIGEIEGSKRLAIETLYELVNDGDMSSKKFNDKIKNILNSSMNELRNLIKKLIKEGKWSEREKPTYKEKQKWENDYYKSYDDWMPFLDYLNKNDERMYARELFNKVGYGNMKKDAFNQEIKNASKQERWGIEITKKEREEEQTREKEAREKFAKEKRF